MSDNMSDLRKLRTAVQQVTDDLNLKVAEFAITPGKDEDDNDILKVVLLITAEAVETIEETEQRHVDDDFAAIFAAEFGDSMSDFADDETKALIEAEAKKKAQAAEDLRKAIEELEGE